MTLDRLLRLGLAIMIVLQVGVLAYHLGLVVTFPYDLNYGEGYVLNDAVRLSRAEPLYVDLQQFPMVRSPYPPLFPLIWSWLVPLTGAQLWVGRALSVAGLIGVCGLLAWHANRARAGRWAMVVAPGLVCASPFVYQWAGFARVDLLALMLAVGGVLVAHWVPGWRGVMIAAALCGLALWTKQTTVTAALGVAIAVGLRDWRQGLGFSALVAGPTLACVAFLNQQTGGEFARHVVFGNAINPISLPRAIVYVGTLVVLHLPMFCVALWWLFRAGHRARSPIAVYVPVAMLAAFSVGNEGSSVNYLIEGVVACALVLPLAWQLVPKPVAMLALAQLVLLVHWPNTFGTDYLFSGRTPTAADRVIASQVDELVRTQPGEVIAEPAGFAARNGLPVYLQPIDLRAEQVLGRWRSGPLVDALADGRFRLIVTAWDLFPEEVDRAIDAHFQVVQSLPSPDGMLFRIYRYAG
jgi:hypothetical protein